MSTCGQLAGRAGEGQHGRARTRKAIPAASPPARTPVSFRALPPPDVRTLSRLLWCCPFLLACGGGGQRAPETSASPPPVARPFAALAEQRVIVAPAHRLSDTDPMGWTAQIPRSREYLRTLDDAIGTELAERGLKTQWVYPADLVRAARRSPTYATDPYTLAADPLRNPNIGPSAKLSEPLASQIRTMIALQDARLVLIPVELRFDKDRTGQGIAVLRLALLDGRFSEVRWVGEVRSEPSATLSPAVLASLATRLGDLITAR
jgi:hypothetical protein